MISFQEFPKIPRYKREVIITEKIDGTNAAVRWEPLLPGMYDPNEGWLTSKPYDENVIAVRELFDNHGTNLGPYALLAQSRTRFILPEKTKKGADNHAFGLWVSENVDELAKLGPGVHYGEWWGKGIQRNYGLQEKRFSLFNVSRWGAHNPGTPACCHVVPVLGRGLPNLVDDTLYQLRHGGSAAAPGFEDPEGIIVWHTTSKQYYKVLLENDDTPKSQQVAA
jgi:hypothetical protein